MIVCRLCLAALVIAIAPLQALAKEKAATPTSIRDASPEQIAEMLPAPIKNAMLSARNRKQYVAATVEFAKVAAGKDGVLTGADAKGLAPDDPRAVQIRYYLTTPYLKRYFTPHKIGSRSVPRIPLRKMARLAETMWDKFDVNHDGVLSDEEKAPLRLPRGGSSNSYSPM